MEKLKTFDSSYFIGKNHFEEERSQNYLVFQPMYGYFKLIANTKYISEWKSKGISDERIKPLNTSDNNLISNKITLKFNRSCLKQLKLTYSHGRTVNIYIVYELGASSLLNDDATLKKTLAFCLALLDYLKRQILLRTWVMELDLIENQVFHFHLVDLVKT